MYRMATYYRRYVFRYIKEGENLGVREKIAYLLEHLFSTTHSDQPVMYDCTSHLFIVL